MKVCQGSDSEKKDTAVGILNGKWLVHYVGAICNFLMYFSNENMH